jgi:hypothetical protein
VGLTSKDGQKFESSNGSGEAYNVSTPRPFGQVSGLDILGQTE